MYSNRRTWGFRCSTIDVAVIVIAASATWMLWPSIGGMTGAIPMVVFHFFLFCNVFRIIRWKELAWSAIFLLNMSYWALFGDLSWLGILSFQSPITAGLIWTEIRHPRYHGILANRLNPRLHEYLISA